MTLEAPTDKPQLAPSAEALALETQLALQARTIFVFGEINDKLALSVCRQLLVLSEQSEQRIRMFISSPGGHVESGDAVHDMISFVPAPVTVIGTGWVGSAAAHIFLAAPKERRVCLPNTRFLIHQPSGGMGGQATDIAIQAAQILRARERIAGVIARQTGQALDKVLTDIDRDYWMSAHEAIDYGIVSRVIARHADLAGD